MNGYQAATTWDENRSYLYRTEYRGLIEESYSSRRMLVVDLYPNNCPADRRYRDEFFLDLAKGYDSLVLCSLFAKVADCFSDVLRHGDPVGSANDDYIRESVGSGACDVVAAWGGDCTALPRAAYVLGMFSSRRVQVLDSNDNYPDVWRAAQNGFVQGCGRKPQNVVWRRQKIQSYILGQR